MTQLLLWLEFWNGSLGRDKCFKSMCNMSIRAGHVHRMWIATLPAAQNETKPDIFEVLWTAENKTFVTRNWGLPFERLMKPSPVCKNWSKYSCLHLTWPSTVEGFGWPLYQPLNPNNPTRQQNYPCLGLYFPRPFSAHHHPVKSRRWMLGIQLSGHQRQKAPNEDTCEIAGKIMCKNQSFRVSVAGNPGSCELILRAHTGVIWLLSIWRIDMACVSEIWVLRSSFEIYKDLALDSLSRQLIRSRICRTSFVLALVMISMHFDQEANCGYHGYSTIQFAFKRRACSFVFLFGTRCTC
jgi:hypothetical protein